MSDLAKQARAAMKAKAKSLTADRPLERVDSSTFTPPPMLNADVKTGMRPISRRAFKTGGKVEGSCAAPNMGRMPRKSGGKAITANSLINRNAKDANEEREGIKHIGGMKKGGRAKKMGGGPLGMMGGLIPMALSAMSDDDKDKKKSGGRAQKADGGPMAGASAMMKKAQDTGGVPSSTLDSVPATSRLSRAAGLKKGGKVHEDVAADKALIKKMVKPSARMNRATGGRTKGKTNINIVIAAGKPADAGDMMPNPMGGPTKPPGMDGMPGGMPVQVPPPAPGGAPAPMPMPMPMPMPAGGPPMPRKSGGRAKSYKDMTAGAGSGEGRLQKTEIAEYKRDARKAGGRTYRSYKDMDAGAGSGLGRLEKTEIQAHKK